MNTLLALTLELPDWLFDGGFWSGFFTAVGIGVALILFAAANFNPFGR
jgi:hypothetical protein